MQSQKQIWLNRGFVFLLVAILAGLFISRAVLSIASVALLFVFFVSPKSKLQWQGVLSGVGLLLLPVVLSGLWSENLAEWWRAVEVKLPLLTIGLAISVHLISMTTWKAFVITLLVLTTLGSFWSTWQYLQHTDEILAGYLQARVMPTPLNDDHIRFSWLVVLSMLLAVPATFKSSVWLRNTVYILCGWLVIYLHLLSAKTGLLCLYVSLAGAALHLLSIQKKRGWSAMIIATTIAAPLLAYAALPSFKNRVQYVLYDFSNYSRGNFMSGLSDGARVLSVKAGWAITNQHPIAGVGFGDLKPAINDWHQQYFPHTKAFERFLPLNEWLLYGAGSGWPGMLLFTLGILLLLRPLWVGGILCRITAVVLTIPLITDDTLESQFGVVIFIFVLMWMRMHQQLKVST